MVVSLSSDPIGIENTSDIGIITSTIRLLAMVSTPFTMLNSSTVSESTGGEDLGESTDLINHRTQASSE